MRDNAEADEVAHALFTMMVEEEQARDNPEDFNIPRALVPGYRAKMRLYREAVVLLLLVSQAQKDLRYEKVLQAYERRVIGPAPTAEGLAKLDALKAAMEDLSALLVPEGEGRSLTWSRTWLTALGHDETNPVTLTRFAIWWMDRTIVITNALQKVRPTEEGTS